MIATPPQRESERAAPSACKITMKNQKIRSSRLLHGNKMGAAQIRKAPNARAGRAAGVGRVLCGV